MVWTTPRELKAQLARLWDRGVVLRSLLTDEVIFPLRLSVKAPTAAELTDSFEAVREWAAALTAMPHVRIEWREVRHRVHGLQRLPQQVWIESLDDALTVLGKRRDAERLTQLADRTRMTVPALLPWLARFPLQAIELAEHWSALLAVVRWVIEHPRPGIYFRQVDVPGIHSKFIEAHRAVLSDLLNLALPSDAIEVDQIGVNQFARRFGFLDKPPRIRFRVLDQRMQILPGPVCPDITLDIDSFASLDLPVKRVFITENEINFLAFPAADDAIVIFGAGYGWAALARAAWLARCEVFYWGDIDTHGFAILDQLRSRFAHVLSFLMDKETLLAHQAQWGVESERVVHDLDRLSVDERELYDLLRDDRINRNLRLEQERLAFGWVTSAVLRVTGSEYSEHTVASQA